jgi:hypothetical protein
MRIATGLLSGVIGVVLVGAVASELSVGTECPTDNRD